MKPQGEIKAAIPDGMTRFEQEYMGRGSKDIRRWKGLTRPMCPQRPCGLASRISSAAGP